MIGAARHVLGQPSVEMTSDPRFAARVRRLCVISSVALGLLTLLVATRAGSSNAPALLLVVLGWLLMPGILAVSLGHPRRRYLLVIPATAVACSLTVVSIHFANGLAATAGWWMITTGVLVGGTLGMWFWYRWLPVPRSLDDPYSVGRWALIAVHVGLIAAGGMLVLL